MVATIEMGRGPAGAPRPRPERLQGGVGSAARRAGRARGCAWSRSTCRASATRPRCAAGAPTPEALARALAPLVAELAPVAPGGALAGDPGRDARSPASTPDRDPGDGPDRALGAAPRRRRFPPRGRLRRAPAAAGRAARWRAPAIAPHPPRPRAPPRRLPQRGGRPVPGWRATRAGGAAGQSRPTGSSAPTCAPWPTGPRAGSALDAPAAGRAARAPTAGGGGRRATGSPRPAARAWLASAPARGRGSCAVADAGHFPHLERPEVVVPAIAGPPRVSDELLDLALAAARAAGDLLLERVGGPASGLASKSSRTDLVSDSRPRRRGAGGGDDPRRAPRRRDRGRGGRRRRSGGSGITLAGGSARRHHQLPLGDPPVERQHRGARRRGRARRGGARPLPRRDLPARPAAPARASATSRSRCAPAPPLAEALIGTGFSYRAEERARQARAPGAACCPRSATCAASARPRSTWPGSPPGASTATSSRGLNPWDRAAGELLVREAGGAVEEHASAGLVAAEPALLGPLRALLDDVPA